MSTVSQELVGAAAQAGAAQLATHWGTRIASRLVPGAGWALLAYDGISLGGYGAILTARAYPDLVDGVVLIAPMLGVPPREDGVAREIIAAGGLHGWPGLDALAPAPRHHFREPRLVWDWLRDVTLTRPESLVLAFGEEDRYEQRHRLLARAMDPSRVFAAPGEHEWKTWRRLWNDVLSSEPWSTATPAMCPDIGSSPAPAAQSEAAELAAAAC